MIPQRLHHNPHSKILEAASRLFYWQGYHSTGINQVISEAGVAKASFYSHFSSKEDLCIAYLKKRHQDWFAWLQAEVWQEANPCDRILGLFVFLEKWLPSCDFRGCAFLNIASEFPLPNSRVQLLVVSHKKNLHDYIEQLVSELDISSLQNGIVPLTNVIYLMFEGAINKSQIYRSTQFIQDTKEVVRQLIS
jgi:AcrR family transcriptional regulator